MAQKETWVKKLTWLVIAAFVGGFVTWMFSNFQHWNTQRHILNELQFGRDQLHLASASFDLNWRRSTNVKFNYEGKVSEAINYQNGDKVLRMYQALENGIKEANRLNEELGKKSQDQILIANLKSAIIRSLDAVDEIGPSVADYMGGDWKVTPRTLPPQEVVTRLERAMKVTTASSETVKTINPSNK